VQYNLVPAKGSDAMRWVGNCRGLDGFMASVTRELTAEDRDQRRNSTARIKCIGLSLLYRYTLDDATLLAEQVNIVDIAL